MARRKVVYCGDPVLRRKASRVRRIDDEICSLLDDMRETMLEHNGLGLAAAQVGVPSTVVVIRRDPEGEGVIELINPRIVRPSKAAVEAIDRDGNEILVEGEGMIARCLVHELDHLAGRLFIDEVDPETLCWLRPDQREESGYRAESTTLEEAREAFERLRRQKREA
ncbi:MAG: peptide deformylase [Armatimonadota bacterium]